MMDSDIRVVGFFAEKTHLVQVVKSAVKCKVNKITMVNTTY